jgi:hypothetical protein
VSSAVKAAVAGRNKKSAKARIKVVVKRGGSAAVGPGRRIGRKNGPRAKKPGPRG